jgi:hypothetical protein
MALFAEATARVCESCVCTNETADAALREVLAPHAPVRPNLAEARPDYDRALEHVGLDAAVHLAARSVADRLAYGAALAPEPLDRPRFASTSVPRNKGLLAPSRVV